MKLNPDMRPFDEVKNVSVNYCSDVTSLSIWLIGVVDLKRAQEENFVRMGLRSSSPKICYHSNHRYLHQRLLSIVF